MAMYDKNKPYIVTEEPGLKEYCACGLTEDGPYCDGSHMGKETGKRPFLVKVVEPRVARICGCGKSAKLPYCDGNHKEDK